MGLKAEIPALLTRMSRPPKRAAMASVTARTWPASETSRAQAWAEPPARRMASAAASADSPLKSVTATCAPSAPKISAVALPMPDPAPVTWAMEPWSERLRAGGIDMGGLRSPGRVGRSLDRIRSASQPPGRQSQPDCDDA